MKMTNRFLLLSALVATPVLASAHTELAREPRGIDTIVPSASPSPAPSSARKITIYTAKAIVTLDPGTPAAEAVAVINGKILESAHWTRSAAGSPTRTWRSTGDFKRR